MARRSKKGRKAQVADSSSVLQPRENLKSRTQAQETKPQKKQNRSSAGSRKNKNKAASLSNVQITKLTPPDGCCRPSQQAKKSNAQKCSKKMNNHQPAHAPQAQAQDLEEPEMTKPWDLDPKYPKPLTNYCAWDYDRSAYRSMPDLDVEDELNKQLVRSRRRQLRLPSPQMSEEELEALHKQYWEARESGLFRARLANMNHSGLPKLFIANSAVDASEISSVNDNSILVQLLRVSELGRMIVDLINPSIGDITALAMSCKRVAACTRAKFDVWDSRSGVFPLEPYAEEDDEGRIVQTGGFRANTLIITPTSDEPKDPEKPYETDFRNMMQLCDAITHIPSTFRSIVLDQLQFFDVSMFDMMVNSMPKLTTVTITRCLLLDVTKLKPLLDVIKRHPRRLESTPSQTPSDDPWNKKSKQYTLELKAQAQTQAGPSKQKYLSKQNGSSKQNVKEERHQQETPRQAQQGVLSYIRLDFSPFFFHGPESGPRLGSYGVTYNEPTFNAPKAVFALIMQCRDLADKVGMDLLSDSSSFWGFVRRLPGPDALWAIKARETLMTYEHELAVGKKSTETIWNRFADELTAALTGDNQAHPRIPTAMSRYAHHKMTKGYWRDSENCLMCHSAYPASLFPIRRDACWSCKMERYVEAMEDSHLRLWQESALRNWRSGLKRGKTDFKTLISYRKPTLDRALTDVRCADLVRTYFLDFRPPKQNTAEYDWGSDTPPKQLYCPPPPRGLDSTRNSMARWRWERAPATAAFDYRKGGPQRSHPCRVPISPGDYADLDYGPEAKANFDSRWEWNRRSDVFFKEIWFEEYRAMDAKGSCRGLPPGITDDQHPVYKEELKRARHTKRYRRQVRDIEWRTQNKEDKKMYILHLHFVEDCLFSMSTLAHKPFNLDKPIPDPGVSPGEYNRLLDEHRRMSNYGFRKDGYFN